MTIKLGVVMDPIRSIHYKKDSTLAMLWEAQRRGWTIYYFEQSNLFLRDGIAFGNARYLTVFRDAQAWYTLDQEACVPLSDLNIILMRKDPPFDLEYIYTTHVLEFAEKTGTLIVNKPQSLRDANEKLYTAWFPQCCAPLLVARDIGLLREFYSQHQDIVCKPLGAMGGASIFRLRDNDENASVIFEVLTANATQFVMAQKYIPAIREGGDKRIIMINGEPVPYALARIPAQGELRGNLAAGATGIAKPLTKRDRWLCQQIAPTLKEKGLIFVGVDVIGDFITEINVTSPTCIRELDEQCNINISEILLDYIEVCIKTT